MSLKTNKKKNNEKTNYINNEKMYNALVERYNKIEENKKLGLEPPKISNYLALCIISICNGLSKHKSFSRYSYLDEMIADAQETCISAIDKFDVINYKSPFSYYTQIASWAFIRRIEAEKKQQYIKHKNLQSNFYSEYYDEYANNDQGELSNKVIQEYEEKIKVKKEKIKNTLKKSKGISKFIED